MDEQELVAVDVSVVICTRNRDASLRRTLDSLVAMHVPEALAWEVLIVDNGSTDDTAAVVDGFVGTLPIRRVLEPAAGLSHARNRGVVDVQGDYIVWTDDDVVVDRGWLAGYVSAFARHKDAACFGGRVEPRLEPPTPAWFQDNLDLLSGLTARRDFGPVEIPLSIEGRVLPFGANFAVKTSDQRCVRYDVDLGVSPRFKRSGEETALLRTLLRGGASGWWVPDASVTHLIPRRRQSTAGVLAHVVGVGATWAYLCDTGGDTFMGPLTPIRNTFRGAPRWFYKRAAEHLVRATLARPFARRTWLQQLLLYGYFRGAIGYFWNKRRIN